MLFCLSDYLFFVVCIIKDETNEVIADLREEIGKLRDKIASTSEPGKEDVLKMEVSSNMFILEGGGYKSGYTLKSQSI